MKFTYPGQRPKILSLFDYSRSLGQASRTNANILTVLFRIALIQKTIFNLYFHWLSLIRRFFSWAVSQKLKPGPNQIADLVAINIQRGRDHGLPAFGDFNSHFDVNNFTIPADLENMLKGLYGSDLSKVDLYVGGLLLENPTYGSHVGPTFSHILAEGFR